LLILWEIGNKLSRRERRLLVNTAADIFRLVPFSFFVIIPAAELSLPFFLKFFPNMLPSTFTSKDEEVRYDIKQILMNDYLIVTQSFCQY